MFTRTCSICGDANGTPGRWFLVVENSWEDKLKILEWNQRLACHEGVHQACSIGHVQELVVHWMTTGSLDYPFAQLRLLGRNSRLRPTDTEFPLSRPRPSLSGSCRCIAKACNAC